MLYRWALKGLWVDYYILMIFIPRQKECTIKAEALVHSCKATLCVNFVLSTLLFLRPSAIFIAHAFISSTATCHMDGFYDPLACNRIKVQKNLVGAKSLFSVWLRYKHLVA